MTNAYGNLSLHHSRYEYKRGDRKGDAPADHTRRAKNHFRVIKPDDVYPYGPYQVRFWSTNIMLAYADGRVVFNTNGFHDRPTTREAVMITLGLAGFSGYMHSKRIGTLSQTALTLNGKTYAYYDGMEFDASGTLLTRHEPFKRERVDRALTKEFQALAKPFRDTLPLLWAAHTPRPSHASTDAEMEILQRLKITVSTVWHSPATAFDTAVQEPGLWPYLVWVFHDETPQKTWANIYKRATARMVEQVPEPL
jgi:hypothetical protein